MMSLRGRVSSCRPLPGRWAPGGGNGVALCHWCAYTLACTMNDHLSMDKLGHVTPLAVRNLFFFSKFISVYRNRGWGRPLLGLSWCHLVFPSIKICLQTIGSQLVNKAKTNYSYLSVDTRRSTERLDDPLALWSAVSNLTVMELCYMWSGDNGEAVRRGRGINVWHGKKTSNL
jgi:hypothetical protein